MGNQNRICLAKDHSLVLGREILNERQRNCDGLGLFTSVYRHRMLFWLDARMAIERT